jgi:hypothetical protein
VTLRKLNDLHNGEQLPDGSYVILHKEMTLCDDCHTKTGWGFTEYADAVPGDSCELCP